MTSGGMGKKQIATAVERAPAVAGILRKTAGKVARGVALPASVSFPDLDYAAQRELEGIFGVQGHRNASGRFSIAIPEPLRESSAWREALDYFGLSHGAEEDGEDVVSRLKLLEPGLADVLDELAANDETARFLAKRENRRDWRELFRAAIRRSRETGHGDVTTLSQLGSDWFGDSKKLRSGPLKRQLGLILAALSGQDASDERAVLDNAQIIDNPYTSAVTFSAPVRLRLKDGALFDYPDAYFARRMAVQLPLETILTIQEIEWAGERREVTTSENAAPFATLVAAGVPAVYTAGYPVLAVKAFLRALASAGITCVHAGDADLDGFRIADEVARCIPVTRVLASDALKCAKPACGIPLTEEQSARARAFLEKHPDFRHASDIRRLLSRGCWIEQETFVSNDAMFIPSNLQRI